MDEWDEGSIKFVLNSYIMPIIDNIPLLMALKSTFENKLLS